jgi:hypothetical protein
MDSSDDEFVSQGLHDIDPQHPPNEEQGDDRAHEMNDPVACCFRLAKIEHAAW